MSFQMFNILLQHVISTFHFNMSFQMFNIFNMSFQHVISTSYFNMSFQYVISTSCFNMSSFQHVISTSYSNMSSFQYFISTCHHFISGPRHGERLTRQVAQVRADCAHRISRLPPGQTGRVLNNGPCAGIKSAKRLYTNPRTPPFDCFFFFVIC